ncbi:MAG: hypothetical protein Q8877_02820 [Sweet potato little leaf phytoplasma]|nr:hypothetical protein [Sweet potato little leaf phytoplasma]
MAEWCDRLEPRKKEAWIAKRIYDFIRETLNGIKMDTEMIGAASYFWSRSTNTFHFHYGMMTPTLLDVAALTGLRPNAEVLTLESKAKWIHDIGPGPYTFNSFVSSRLEKYSNDAEVIAIEHAEFLTLWLSYFVFASKLVKLASQW